MRNIIIIEAVSTGYNLVEDAVRRGCRPVVMELPGDSKDIDDAVSLTIRDGQYSLP